MKVDGKGVGERAGKGAARCYFEQKNEFHQEELVELREHATEQRCEEGGAHKRLRIGGDQLQREPLVSGAWEGEGRERGEQAGRRQRLARGHRFPRLACRSLAKLRPVGRHGGGTQR